MLPIKRDHVIQQGADWSWSFVVYGDDGAAVNLTGATVTMQVRDGPNGGLLASPTVTVTTAASGICAAALTDTDTANMDWDWGVYDVHVEESGGNMFYAYEGEFVLRRRITRVE